MFFFNFFEKSNEIVTLLGLLFLLFCTIYVSNLKQRGGLFCFLCGFVMLCVVSLFQQSVDYFYSHAVSAKTFIFVEMLLLLISSLLMITGATKILLDRYLDAGLLFAFISGMLIIIIYSIFIVENAGIIDELRRILPIIGFGYMILSFLATPKFWLKLGNLVVILSLCGFAFLLIYPLFFHSYYDWYIPNILIFTLGFGYILMSNEKLKRNINQMQIFQNRHAENLKNIIKSSPFPIVLSRLGDDTFIMANNNALKLFGIEETELNRYHFKDFFVDSENRKILTERLEFNREVHDFEILVRTAAGNTPFWLLLSANVVEYNNDVVLYSAFQDITIRKRQESVLRSQADRDPLTSMYNRRYFEVKAAQKIKNAHIQKTPFAILMLDADKFKSINDKYGHKIGDKVLIELSAVCERSLRPEDVVARYGGEEFVVFVDNVDKNTAVMVANRLRKAISESVVYADDNTPVTFSVSIGVAPSGISDNVSIMIKMADDAMYLAKQNGRNRVEIYDKESVNKLSIEEQTSKNIQKHPAFSNEDTTEISLLDGIESASIIEE